MANSDGDWGGARAVGTGTRYGYGDWRTVLPEQILVVWQTGIRDVSRETIAHRLAIGRTYTVGAFWEDSGTVISIKCSHH